MSDDVSDWMDKINRSNAICYIKRLSGNDTLANKSHQAGPYIPKEFLFHLFPKLNNSKIANPRESLELCVDSHNGCREVRAIWYNNKTRDEARITGLGGSSSALLDPENTGALAIFAFFTDDRGKTELCRVWVCRNQDDEEIIEDQVGLVEPGRGIIRQPNGGNWDIGIELAADKHKSSCRLSRNEIPNAWLKKFPTGQELVQKSVILRPGLQINPDKRILTRRDCEYDVFRSVEEVVELPIVTKGFPTIDSFIERAQTILQRRKSRSGRSLELQARTIFIEEGMKPGKDFSYDCESEFGKKPDFIFPSEAAYKNKKYLPSKLRMLAVKTTCKDRWRQILNEADKIKTKHLLTLQEGVSENQFQEMAKANVQLVVPKPLFVKYPKVVRPQLQSVEQFISEVKAL